MFWHRLERDPQLVYGVQLNLEAVRSALQAMLSAKEPVASDSLRARGSSWEYAPAGTRQAFSGPVLPRDGALVILDDNAVPVAATDEKLMQVARKKQWLTADAPRFDFKHPLVATEIGESLPHWEVAAYLRNPESLKRTARTIQLTLGLLVAALISAIGVGGWLIEHDLNRQLALARQKTDFVSNVSHELKTPLTSIRMFAELLAEGRVSEPAKQRSYLNIITAEASRLTRLINNVLDFARIERGQKKYNFAGCDLVALATETAATLRPHLESAGFKFEVVLLASSITVHADRDAVAQVIVNLLSNAEKYSNGMKEITMELERRGPTDGVGTRNQNQGESKAPAGVVELRVLDRGPGVPGVCEERIFEQFFRVNDSLTNAVPGSGLGLTLARQIARAHGGDVTYAAREGGGSVFTLQLPERNQQSS
jgi:signal transduction histidine kinase